jgi:hypothetical protein
MDEIAILTIVGICGVIFIYLIGEDSHPRVGPNPGRPSDVRTLRTV